MNTSIVEVKRQFADINKKFLVAFIKFHLLERTIVPSLIGCLVSGAIYIVLSLVMWKPSAPNYMNEALLVARMNVLEETLKTKKKDSSEDLMHLVEAHLGLRTNVEEMKADLALEPTVVEAWVGYFDFIYCGRRMEGMVDIVNTRFYTKKENREWIIAAAAPTEAYLSQMVAHGTKLSPNYVKYYEWDATIHCKIHLKSSQELRYLTGPRDILVHHYDNIEWSRKLLPREGYA
jgi:hypothetical protein